MHKIYILGLYPMSLTPQLLPIVIQLRGWQYDYFAALFMLLHHYIAIHPDTFQKVVHCQVDSVDSFLSFHSIFYHIPFPTSFTNLCLLECLIVLADPKQSRSTAAEPTTHILVYLLLTRPPMHTDDIKTST